MRKLKKKSLPAAAAAGLVCAVALTAILCLPFAGAACLGRLPMSSVKLWGMLSAGLAVFTATLAVVRLRCRQALPTAGLVAGGYVLLCVLLCLGTGGCADLGPWLLRMGGAVLAGGMLGAFMSLRKNTRKRRRQG